MKVNTLFKFMVLLAVSALYLVFDIYMTAIYPVIGNALAMAQMQNSSDSSMWILIYSKINNYAWEIWIFLTLLLFWREILNTCKKVKEILNDEED